MQTRATRSLALVCMGMAGEENHKQTCPMNLWVLSEQQWQASFGFALPRLLAPQGALPRDEEAVGIGLGITVQSLSR